VTVVFNTVLPCNNSIKTFDKLILPISSLSVSSFTFPQMDPRTGRDVGFEVGDPVMGLPVGGTGLPVGTAVGSGLGSAVGDLVGPPVTSIFDGLLDGLSVTSLGGARKGTN
jgi:hypothetical protein